MSDERTSDQLCPHPDDQVQSGIYARGIWEAPVCMACGEKLLSKATIQFLDDIEHEEYP
jgi:hypothetical protein